MSNNTPCVNTILIDRHLDSIDVADGNFNAIYNYIVAMFRNSLENASCREDVNDDLVYETRCRIDYEEFDTNYQDVVDRIYDDYDLK